MGRKVSYFYDADMGSYYYGAGHPMKPQRVRMAYDLVRSYGLTERLIPARPSQGFLRRAAEHRYFMHLNWGSNEIAKLQSVIRLLLQW